MQSFKLEDSTALTKLYQTCKDHLCNTSDIIQISYPENLAGKMFSKNNWSSCISIIKEINEGPILSKLRNNVTNYSVFTCKNGMWQLRYIGQTKSALARSRLTNHLISKDDGTGAKLELVQEAVRNGLFIGIKLAKVEPESLRHYVEERFIEELSRPDSLDWNKHLKK